ncbi:glycosyltransferase family 4 protein [Tissierella creatinophila]|uniref:D-inositol-3-phosphate glycosyltransferase n=1 Tax=Tissierella creatinophila DSM 6911 TaxID=1123403 RepID=A0A1U7M5R6_TISCR|nr:glycosyltransferase family 4 protein [Tissierella creatinophila]OLS02625.1 D-inositol-3-phosphate glycosyltransferase [Tissierella creatinophila DSM 6911]
MKVCIIRNAEARTNASLKRVISGVLSSGNTPILLTRSRYSKEKGVFKREYSQENELIDNYEINIKAQTGRGLSNIFQLLNYQFVVLKWLLKNKDKFDIIHAFDLDAGLMVYLFSKYSKKKYIYHIADFYIDSRGINSNLLRKLVRKLEYSVINNAQTTIICTEKRREQIAGSKPKDLLVLHNTPSKKEILESSFKNDKITFTYVGGLTRNRFIEDIIDIFKENKNFQLRLAGMGNVDQYAKEMSLENDNIEYYGMIDYEEALKLYAKTDVMFAIYDPKVPNYRYSAPNKVYEAMMYGKPIIVAQNTGVDNIVLDEKMGFSIPYSKDGFKEILKSIEKDPSVLEKMGKNASLSYEKYSWNVMKDRLVDLYKDIEIKL